MARNLSKHAEWLSLVEVSGPFLAVAVLDRVFPQGLEAIYPEAKRHIRSAYEEWCDAVSEDDKDLQALHKEWVHLVISDFLEIPDKVLLPGNSVQVPSDNGVGGYSPEFVLQDEDAKPKLFVGVYPPGTNLTAIDRRSDWTASPLDKMTKLCLVKDVRLGLLTNGEEWMLVNAPNGKTSGSVTWYARLWFQEPRTLQAFSSLLGVRRFFGPENETLPALIDESLDCLEEVTDTHCDHVRTAVEVLIQGLYKADQDRNRELLRDIRPAELYEAGLTVMMRLVFLLCAEERGLLLLGTELYDQNYAVSTLRSQLASEADKHGAEILERRHDAWARLLAIFRAVYGGLEHAEVRLPALGGSIFDPDKYPFLEGRAKGTCWKECNPTPLPIDNRTVLLLLNSLQVLEQTGGAILLSYRALDVEQIGHIYEGLLEHTAARTPEITLGLRGSAKAKNPNITLPELESLALEPTQQRKWNDTAAYAITRYFRVAKISMTARTLSNFLEKTMFVAIIWFGAKAVFDGTLSVGALIAFQMLSGRVTAPLVRIVGLVHEYQQTALSVKMLGVVMNCPGEQVGGSLHHQLRGEISIENVSFQYTPDGPRVIKDCNLHIAPGTTVGQVGRSGSGKSTLTKLNQGLYPLQAGIIKFDGIDIREIDRSSLRSNIGIVLQDNYFFYGTVRENLTLTKKEASMEEVIYAARMAGADEFIQKMPKGYDSILEENASNLSGGQRQRLAIARALLPNPRILIFDEATSALDPESETLVRRNLKMIARNRTVFIISHRLSILCRANKIVVMDKGELVESGTHRELIGRNGIYAEFWRQQMGTEDDEI